MAKPKQPTPVLITTSPLNVSVKIIRARLALFVGLAHRDSQQALKEIDDIQYELDVLRGMIVDNPAKG